jgi:hypothetical protein
MHGTNIEAVLQLLETDHVNIDNGNIVVFPGQGVGNA